MMDIPVPLGALCDIIGYICGMNAIEYFELGQELRRNRQFGEAINAYRAAAASPDCPEDIRRTALASVELMQEINGFVNADLMNP
jgi:hypothetical protein